MNEYYMMLRSGEFKKHVNEKCKVCGKLLDFDTWFCYHCLCTECFINGGD